MTYVNIDVEIDLDDIETSDLIDELEARGYKMYKDVTVTTEAVETLVHHLWMARLFQVENMDEHLNNLFEYVLNKRI